MSSKDKEISKSKFKLFVKGKTSTGNSGERNLRPEIERELQPEHPVAQRCKTLKDMGELQLNNLNLEESSIMRLWDLTNDLIVPNKPAEVRQTALTFYMELIHSQYKNLTILREHFFYVIQNHEVPEDLRHRLELLDTLTENGKDIKGFEEKIGKFMLLWIPAITEANQLRPYLDMLANLIKFNAAHLENDIVVGIVQNACYLSCIVEEDEIGLQCLTILELVMCYTIFPTEPLHQCVVTLCRTVNHSPYCHASWKIMKNLLGTQSGYHSMKMMCAFLNDRSLYEDQQLLRGAVFHLNMNIFSSNVIFQVSPMFYASTVLMGFLNALDSRQVIVTFEVILSVRKVINKYKTELPEIIWDRICDIMSAIQNNIEFYEKNNISLDHLQHLQSNFHENIDCIEKLMQQEEKPQIMANYDRIYDLIERVSEQRPEVSVLKLIEYRSSKITATRPKWLQVLNDFVNRFYKVPNMNVRTKTIESLVHIMDMHRASYEEEILDRIVIPRFALVAQEPDIKVRIAVTKALVDFARHCDTKRCMELLEILEKIVNRPFEQHHAGGSDAADLLIKTEADVADTIAAVDGLIEVFVVKLYRLPSAHAIRIFNILIGHLELHYERPKVFEHISVIRFKIFTWMLKARANGSYHIGYPEMLGSDVIKFSPYLGIDSSLPMHNVASSQHPRHQIMTQISQSHDLLTSASHFTTISIRRACKMIVKCLEIEKDFQIFQLVIKGLPKVLQNKALIQGNDIEALALALFKICGEGNKLVHLSYKPTTDERHALALPAIASLVIYHQFIQPSHQITIISNLFSGILSAGIANLCINTMTTMILEMPESLIRLLADILLQMSKMSDTTVVAIPVLEFLSILSRLSNHLFTNFTPRQYMYVFAISLPYTKPSRYDHYTVSLAHHVIAGWFLKCKLEYRKNLVSYIVNSIQSNANMLYAHRTDFNTLNEDSSNRKRSTSLTERGSRNARNEEMRPLMNDYFKNFHAELAETCIDFLARHTFSPCSALPRRLPSAEYLLKNGLSQTWLVGHNLVTITTSGCPSAATRNGLCERCAQLGKLPNLTVKSSDTAGTTTGTTPLSPEIGGTMQAAERRYTKVSLQHSSGNESAGSTDLTSSSSAVSSGGGGTQRQTSNSSSTSLEALSRRGSNPDAPDNGSGGVGGAGGTGGSSTSLLGNSLSTTSVSASPTPQQSMQQQTCLRSCTGWAEIFIRRPSGNISWIMRIQNPIAQDCFGQEMPFGDIVTLFLPTAYGGVFGPDFVPSAIGGEDTVVGEGTAAGASESRVAAAVSLSRDSIASVNVLEEEDVAVAAAQKSVAVAKLRSLQRQEEISSSVGLAGATSTSAISTAAIDIPKATTLAGKRGKEALSGSVSDGEADDEHLTFNDTSNRARNPVRRVNSSPEMSSSWRTAFLAAKPMPLSKEFITGYNKVVPELERFTATVGVDNELQPQQQQQQQQQKKRSVQYTKDMRVSCEAIPEEIAGSTPPQAAKAAIGVAASASADDVPTNVNLPSMSVIHQSVSAEKLINKPPQSSVLPPQSPRLDKTTTSTASQKVSSSSFNPHQGLAKSSSSGGSTTTTASTLGVGVPVNMAGKADYNNGNGEMRGRSKTISVVREVDVKSLGPSSNFRSFGTAAAKTPFNTKLCLNPSFVFLQLYNTGQLQATDTPIKVPPEEMGTLTLLDLTPPFETHKIGVLYVNQGQCNNLVEILRNSHGSTRYVEFLRSIGTLVHLKDAEQHNLFITLDKNGADGKFTYIWKDDIVHVTFHVATLMPTNLKSDPNCNEKKKHVGNDYVSIIYNESGEEYNLNTISGQFSHACVIVEPLELNTNRIYVKARPEISKFVCHPEPKIVSDRSAPLLARQMALHANLVSQVYQSIQTKNPYASNWLERLRCIKRLRTKLIEHQHHSSSTVAASAVGGSSGPADIDDHSTDALKKQNTNRDFTKYT